MVYFVPTRYAGSRLPCGPSAPLLQNAKVRQQAADLIARIAVVMVTCKEEQLLNHLSVVMYESLGEEYPEVLGSILGALKAIVNVVGMQRMQPPIKDLLPRLTPILKNRHEKVQENCPSDTPSPPRYASYSLCASRLPSPVLSPSCTQSC